MTMRPSLTGLDPSITARLLEHAGDVVILLDAAGCVLDVTARGGALAQVHGRADGEARHRRLDAGISLQLP